MSVVSVRGQSRYQRASALLGSVQYALQDPRINLVSVLITLSDFTDTSIYSPTFKNGFLKYFFSSLVFFFPSCDCQNFYWTARKLAGIVKESVFREKKVVLLPRWSICFLWKVKNK